MSVRCRYFASAVCLLLASPAFSGLVRDTRTGCEVEVEFSQADTWASWIGACTEGKAEGVGILSASNGLHLEGKFRAGKPFDAHGLQVYVTNSGLYAIANLTVTRGKSFLARLSSDKGREWVSAGYLTGEWDWNSADGRCNEALTYQANFLSQVRSADEVLDGVFELLAIPQQGPATFEMRRLRMKSNGKPDCQGHITQLSGIPIVFLRFSDRDTFRTCDSLEESSCYGVARRRGPTPDASLEMVSRLEKR